MRKTTLIAYAIVFALVLSACGGKAEVPIDYGASSIYAQEDMDAAIARIKAEFSGWNGCVLHSIRYAGDDCNQEENIRWMNDLRAGENYTQCIAFLSDFHSPKNDGGAWNADYEYTDWQWWLARTENGNWELLTWGY